MRRSWRMMSAFALLLAAASILFSAFLYSRIQDERTASLERACLRDSSQSEAIIDFLEELGSRPQTLTKARAYFPVLTREQCQRRARESVGSPPARATKQLP